MKKAKNGIEWCDFTWNSMKGCSHVSPGCDNCYAEKLALLFQQQYQQTGDYRLKAYHNGFEPTFLPKKIGDPGDIREPSLFFVNSMSDLFHPAFTPDQVQKIFLIMNLAAPYHIYQILTKRTGQLLKLDPLLKWTPHIWQGATVENADYTVRIDHLRKCGAHIKFLSLEPLLGPLKGMDLTGIDWVIVGGEKITGSDSHKAWPMLEEWRCLFVTSASKPTWHFSLNSGELQAAELTDYCKAKCMKNFLTRQPIILQLKLE